MKVSFDGPVPQLSRILDTTIVKLQDREKARPRRRDSRDRGLQGIHIAGDDL